MKNPAITIVSTLLGVMVLGSAVQAEMVTRDDALTVAKNWVTLIIRKEGNWGGSEWAEVTEIQEFKRGERLLGYFCRVEPRGFIVGSLRKELAPVKAYAARCDLDPESDEGMANLIKAGMQRMLDAIEKQVGPIKSARTQDVQSMLEVNYASDWQKLQHDVQTFKVGLESAAITMDYQPGTWLLTSDWHQRPPYNNDCPDENCSWPDYGYFNENARVGCVATAAAQIMRYWAWPPYGTGSPYSDPYDWANMLDEYVWDDPNSRFHDGDGNPCSQAQINAVAELSYEVGKAAGTDYGCGESSAWVGAKVGADMGDAYKDQFRYNENTDFEQRWHHTDAGWWDIITANLNNNQPLQYAYLDLSIGDGFAAHSMVCDGWQVVGNTRYAHMNYGYPGTGSDAWYDIDDLPGTTAEGMIRNIKPAPSLGSWLSGDPPDEHVDYWADSPATDPPGYRYFDQDAMGRNVTFHRGHYLQFLAGVKVTGTSPIGDYIRFVGTSSENTRLFSIKGIQTGGIVAGIRIYNGGIRLYNNGSLKFH